MTSRAFQIIVNYWELKPAQYPSVFDKLLQQEVDEIIAYVPWQHFESDVTHLLMKFVTLASERGLKIRLIVTPDLGFDHVYSGLPKDLLSKEDIYAQFSNFEKIMCFTPPRSFYIPSHFSEEYTKRYYNFLTRFNSFFGVLDKLQIPLKDSVEILFSGGFWKYYRSPEDTALAPFSSLCLDYSKNSTLGYRKYLEEYYSQDEFSYPHMGAATRWKTKAHEEMNRKKYHASSEEFFRQKTEEVIRKKSLPIQTTQIELFSPEVDPSVFYSEVLRSLGEGVSDFHKLDKLLDEYSARLSSYSGSEIPPYIHWSFFPGVKMLSESEKQYLIMKSMLIAGSKGGAVLMDYREWLQFSPSLRKKCKNFSRAFSEQGLYAPPFVGYLTTHLWSQAHPLWFHLNKQLPYFTQMISNSELLKNIPECQLLIVDPQYLLTQKELELLLEWSKKGGTLVLPKNQLYSGAAEELFNELLQIQKDTLQLNFGISYLMQKISNGKVIIYEALRNTSGVDYLDSWKKFVSALLKMDSLEKLCRVSDQRVSLFPLLYKNKNLSHRYVLFALNGSQRAIPIDLSFNSPVKLKDYVISQKEQHEFTSFDSQSYSRIQLDLPACGIASLCVENLEKQFYEKFLEEKEVHLEKNVMDALSFGELPGLDFEDHTFLQNNKGSLDAGI